MWANMRMTVGVTRSLRTRQMLKVDLCANGAGAYAPYAPSPAYGLAMKPVGKLPVTLTLGARTYTDDFHIYQNATGTLLSWKAAKSLSILPQYYPHPQPTPTPHLATTTTDQPVPTFDIRREFPTVINGQVKTMEGEKFHIALADDAKPSCVNTPPAVPFAFCDKLKAELDLLLEQVIIAPVAEPTEWCAPIVVTPKKRHRENTNVH